MRDIIFTVSQKEQIEIVVQLFGDNIIHKLSYFISVSLEHRQLCQTR